MTVIFMPLFLFHKVIASVFRSQHETLRHRVPVRAMTSWKPIPLIVRSALSTRERVFLSYVCHTHHPPAQREDRTQARPGRARSEPESPTLPRDTEDGVACFPDG